jgi:hypothetical protein
MVQFDAQQNGEEWEFISDLLFFETVGYGSDLVGNTAPG